MKTKRIVQFGATSRLSRQRGASLLEGIAYLGIAAIVVLGAVSLLGGAFGSAQSNQTMEELVSLRTGVRKLYAGQAYGNGNMLPQLVPANVIPATLTVNRANNTVTNTWAGAVTITGAGATFTITYNGVPQDVCINAVSGASGWQNIAGNGANIAVFPATPTQAATVCTGANNNITFTSA